MSDEHKDQQHKTIVTSLSYSQSVFISYAQNQFISLKVALSGEYMVLLAYKTSLFTSH